MSESVLNAETETDKKNHLHCRDNLVSRLVGMREFLSVSVSVSVSLWLSVCLSLSLSLSLSSLSLIQDTGSQVLAELPRAQK